VDEVLLELELPLDVVLLLESSPEEVLDVPVLPEVPDVLEVPEDVPEDVPDVDVEPVEVEPVEVDDPDVPDFSVDVLELAFLLAAVSALATAAKASDPTAVALSRPPVTSPTRRKP
jgi:hypothetical protein